MAEVDAARRVRTPSDVLRKASDSFGRSHLRAGGAVWPLEDLEDRSDRCGVGPWASALLPPGPDSAADELAPLLAYDDGPAVIAAALELQPCGPTQAVTWAMRAEPEVERLVGATAGWMATDQIPAYGAHFIEEWGQRHELADRRLFLA